MVEIPSPAWADAGPPARPHRSARPASSPVRRPSTATARPAGHPLYTAAMSDRDAATGWWAALAAADRPWPARAVLTGGDRRAAAVAALLDWFAEAAGAADGPVLDAVGDDGALADRLQARGVAVTLWRTAGQAPAVTVPAGVTVDTAAPDLPPDLVLVAGPQVAATLAALPAGVAVCAAVDAAGLAELTAACTVAGCDLIDGLVRVTATTRPGGAAGQPTACPDGLAGLAVTLLAAHEARSAAFAQTAADAEDRRWRATQAELRAADAERDTRARDKQIRALERRLERETAKLAKAKEAGAAARRQRDTLARRLERRDAQLAAAEAKLERLLARRWWQLGAALFAAADSPRAALATPARVLRALRK